MVVSTENWILVKLYLLQQASLATDMWFSSPKYEMLLAEIKQIFWFSGKKNIHYFRLQILL